MTNKNIDLEKKIAFALNDLGIPASLKGYQCLKVAVQCAVEDPTVLYAITKRLYPAVAQAVGTTPTRAERCIRQAVEVCFDRLAPSLAVKYFGSCVNPQTGKVTNGEFVGIVAERIRLDL